MNLTVVAIGILGLYIGGNWLVQGSTRLARWFGVSQLIAGLTVVSLVTSIPELLVAINAANRDAGGLVLGSITGSNIANIGLILGLTGLFSGQMAIASGLVRRGIPLMIAIAVAIYIILFFGNVGYLLGSGFVIGFIAFYMLIVGLLRRDAAIQTLNTQEMQALRPIDTQDMLLMDDAKLIESDQPTINPRFELLRLITGGILLVVGADYIVRGALNIADQLGANPVILGATLIALVTSLPELVAITFAARNNQPDVAFGNLIGSGVANLLLVLGAASIVAPLSFDPRLLRYEYPVMLVFMGMLLLVAWDRTLTWKESGLYVLGYIAFFVGIFYV